MKDQQRRQLKLQPRHRALVFGYRMVPELKLCGLWLQEHGFHAGEMVEVTIGKGKLVIKVLSNG